MKDGYMGAFNGKLGPAVAYTWRGRQCLRAYQPNPKDPQTPRQLKSRIIFGTTSKLASRMYDATEIGLRDIAAERQTGITNIFLTLNRHCVSVDNGTTSIDFASLKVAHGILPGVEFGAPSVDGNRVVSVGYSNIGGGGANTDYVYLYAYVPSLESGMLSLPSARCDNRVGLAMPASWTSREAHLYGFVWDHESMASTSAYIGNITTI